MARWPSRPPDRNGPWPRWNCVRAARCWRRDQYTTLPEIHNRPLHMWLDVEWLCSELSSQALGLTACVRKMVHGVFQSFESGSIQQVIYRIGSTMMAELPVLTEVRLEANNR